LKKNWAVRIMVLIASAALVAGGLSIISGYRPYWSGSELPDEISTPSSSYDSARTVMVAGIGNVDGAAIAQSVMIINADLETGSAGVMYLPGNTYVGEDRVKYGILGGAFNWGTAVFQEGGAPALADCLSGSLRLPVDNYVVFDMDALPGLCEKLGGVRVSLEDDAAFSDGNVLEAGEHIFRESDVRRYVLADGGADSSPVAYVRAAFMEGVVRAVMGMPSKEALALASENKMYLDSDITVSESRLLSKTFFERTSGQIDYFTVPGKTVSGAGSMKLTAWSVDRTAAAEEINSRMRAHTVWVLAEELSIPDIPVKK